MATYKGFFRPKNPKKYKGDPNNIIYRSGWEAKFMSYLDGHPDVLEWSSEEFAIPYLSPLDGRMHRYFPDFTIKRRDIRGKVETFVIEIKPKKQTKPPVKQTKLTKRYIMEVKTWGINSSKWDAAGKFCQERGWKFLIMTEDDLKFG